MKDELIKKIVKYLEDEVMSVNGLDLYDIALEVIHMAKVDQEDSCIK